MHHEVLPSFLYRYVNRSISSWPPPQSRLPPPCTCQCCNSQRVPSERAERPGNHSVSLTEVPRPSRVGQGVWARSHRAPFPSQEVCACSLSCSLSTALLHLLESSSLFAFRWNPPSIREVFADIPWNCPVTWLCWHLLFPSFNRILGGKIVNLLMYPVSGNESSALKIGCLRRDMVVLQSDDSFNNRCKNLKKICELVWVELAT